MQRLDLETLGYLLCTTHYPWFKGLGPLFPIVPMHQIYQQFNCNSTISLYSWKTSCWIKTLKLQTLDNLRFIPSHYLEAVDNYNEEKETAINKISPTSGINKTAKMTLLTFPLFQYQRQCLLIKWIYIYIYM